jgi:hypothetical protein
VGEPATRDTALATAERLRPLAVVALRHSGRADGAWRLLLAGDRAVARFDREAERLRQGAAALVVDGVVARFTSGPLLRRRW